jgi:hypothetical protein
LKAKRQRATRPCELPLAVLAVQFHKMHGGRLFQLYAQVAGDLSKRVIEVRKVIDGHISHKCGANFVVARAAVKPPEKNEELDERGESDDDPVGIHGSVFDANLLQHFVADV